ncbi:MAG: type II toxin-antitoxin system RelE family toxin [Nitrososphaerales archaeon]
MSNQQEWKIVEPPDIRKIFKRLGQPEKDQYRLAVRTLAESEDPRVHGEYKKSLDCFTYDITSSYRMAFDVDYENRIIKILSIGDHKQTYGKD